MFKRRSPRSALQAWRSGLLGALVLLLLVVVVTLLSR
jgi:hypothetical protein